MSYFTLPSLRLDDGMTASRPRGKGVSGTHDNVGRFIKTSYQY